MIRSLRARHPVLVVGIGVAASALGLAGLLARRPVPSMDLPLRERGHSAFSSVSSSDELLDLGLSARLEETEEKAECPLSGAEP